MKEIENLFSKIINSVMNDKSILLPNLARDKIVNLLPPPDINSKIKDSLVTTSVLRVEKSFIETVFATYETEGKVEYVKRKLNNIKKEKQLREHQLLKLLSLEKLSVKDQESKNLTENILKSISEKIDILEILSSTKDWNKLSTIKDKDIKRLVDYERRIIYRYSFSNLSLIYNNQLTKKRTKLEEKRKIKNTDDYKQKRYLFHKDYDNNKKRNIDYKIESIDLIEDIINNQSQSDFYDRNFNQYIKTNDLVHQISDHIRISENDFNDFFSCFMNNYIFSAYAISSLIKSIYFESSKRKIRESEIIASDENITGFGYMIFPSSKLTSMKESISYSLLCCTVKSEFSIFKHDLGNKWFGSNIYTDNFERLHYKSSLFDTILYYSYLMYKRGSSISVCRKFFITYFNLLFWCDYSSKMLVSVFKYLNIVVLSDFNKVENLFNKYTKLNFDRYIHLYYLREIERNYNYNRSQIDKLTDEQIKSGKINLNLKTFGGEFKNLMNYTESNCFYTSVYKNVTRYSHDVVGFTKTIHENNSKVNSSKYSSNKFILSEINNTVDYQSKFYSPEVISLSLRLYKDEQVKLGRESKFEDDNLLKFFNKEFENEYENHFLSSRKCMSLDIFTKDSRLEKKILYEETRNFLDNYFSDKDVITPTVFYNKIMIMLQRNEMINQVRCRDVASYCIVSKKEQYESSREIYELNLFGKVCSLVVQILFKYINKRSEREMVVESQAKKLSMIRECSQIVINNTKEHVVYYNGDMGKWSGQDVYSKFIFLISEMFKLQIIEKKVHDMLMFSLTIMKSMKIIIPNGARSYAFEKICYQDNLINKRVIRYNEPWPQGIFHNISSFVHQLEQLFRKRLFNYYINLNSEIRYSVHSHQQLVHSDDKNEIIGIPLSKYHDFVKITTYLPRFFALSTSETKDSFSRISSEMVGVLNMRSFIFDNAVRGASNFYEPFEDRSYSENYKYILNRSVAYYEKSNDLLGSVVMESLGYNYLKRNYKLSDNSEFLTLDTYGRSLAHPDTVRKFGNFADNYIKIKVTEDLNIYNLHVHHRKILNKGLLKNKSQILDRIDHTEDELTDMITYGSSNALPKNKFIASMEIDTILNKLSLFNDKDKISKLYLSKRSNDKTEILYIDRTSMLITGSAKDVCEYIMKRCSYNLKDLRTCLNRKLRVDVPKYLYFSLDNVKSVEQSLNQIYSYKTIQQIEKEENASFINTNLKSLKTFRLFNHSVKLSYLDFERLCNKNFNAVFRTFNSKNNKEKILNDYNSIIKQFSEFKTPVEFERNRYIIESYLEIMRNTTILQFTSANDMYDTIKTDRFLTISEDINRSKFKREQEIKLIDREKLVFSTEIKPIGEIISTIKSIVNSIFITSSVDLNKLILDEIKKSKRSIDEIMYNVSDPILFVILRDIKSNTKKMFKISPNLDPDKLVMFLMGKIKDSNNNNIYVSGIKLKGEIIDISFSTKNSTFSCYISNEHLEYLYNKKKLNRRYIKEEENKLNMIRDILPDINSLIIKFGLTLSVYPKISIEIARGFKFSSIRITKIKNFVYLDKRNNFDQLIQRLTIQPYKDVSNYSLIKEKYAIYNKSGNIINFTIDKVNLIEQKLLPLNLKYVSYELDVKIIINMFSNLYDCDLSNIRFNICKVEECNHDDDFSDYICEKHFLVSFNRLMQGVEVYYTNNKVLSTNSKFTISSSNSYKMIRDIRLETDDYDYKVYFDKIELINNEDKSIKIINVLNPLSVNNFLNLMEKLKNVEYNPKVIQQIKNFLISVQMQQSKLFYTFRSKINSDIMIVKRKKIKMIETLAKSFDDCNKIYPNDFVCNLSMDISKFRREDDLVIHLSSIYFFIVLLSKYHSQIKYICLANTISYILRNFKIELETMIVISDNFEKMKNLYKEIANNDEDKIAILEIINSSYADSTVYQPTISKISSRRFSIQTFEHLSKGIQALKSLSNYENLMNDWRYQVDLDSRIVSFVNNF